MSRKPIIFERDDRMARRQLRMNRLLRLAVIVMVVVASALASLYFYSVLSAEEQAARNRLRTFAELRASAVQRFLQAHKQETALWASQENMRELGRRFTRQWSRLSPAERDLLRRMLAPGSPAPTADTGSAEGGVVRSDAFNAYLALLRETQIDMQAFLEHHGYANLHLFSPEGYLIFSVRQRADFGQNFAVNGSIHAARVLGQAFQRALRLISPGFVVFEDFHPYPGAGDPPRAFFAAPLLEMEGEKIGVLAIELDISAINRILDAAGIPVRDALIYAVGPDRLLRNDLPGRSEPTALRLKMDSPAVRAALNGQSTLVIWKQEGRKRIAAAQPMNFDLTRWAVITEMPLDEMRAPYRPIAMLWGLTLLLIILLGVLQYWLMRRA